MTVDRRGRSSGPAYVGRGPELALLREHLAAANAGTGSVVLISGEPGIGKTRTAEELAAEARERGITVHWGRCYEGEGAPAFWPWVQILRTYTRGRDVAALRAELGPGAADIAQILDELQQRLRLPAPSPQEPAQARFRLFDAVTSFLRNVTAGGRPGSTPTPLLLIFDDLHWADVPSLLLLQFVAREVRNMPLLLLGTYRDLEVDRQHPLTPVLGNLARQPQVQRMHLQGLSEPDVGRLVTLTAGVQLSAGSVTALTHQTEGNPFFVTEAVRLLASEGRLEQPDPPRNGGFGASVPQHVREVINRRLDRLSAACARALAVAAVISRDFSLATLARVTELADEPLLDLLEEAETARLIVPVPPVVGRYRFTHTLIRETLYEELSSARCVRLHRLVGEALEAQYSANVAPHLAELAHHFVQAAPSGSAAKAVAYSRRAAERATALLAYEDAVGHYQRALNALELQQPGDAEECCALMLALGEAQLRAGDRETAKATLREAAAVAHQIGAAGQLARAALAYSGTLLTAGVVDPVILELLGQARAALGEGDNPLAARVLGRLGMEYYYYPDAGERRAALSEEAVAMARRIGDPATLAFTLTARRVARWAPEHIDERLTLATEMLQLAERAGDRDLAAHGHHVRLVDLLELGEIAAVDRELAAHERLATELRDPLYLWHTMMWRVMRAVLEGRFADAEALAERLRADGQRIQAPNLLMVYGAQILALRREQGRPQELEGATAAFAAQNPGILAWQAALAAIHRDLGREAEARRDFDQLAGQRFADVPRNGLWLITMTLLAEVCAFLDDRDRAADLYDLLLPHARLTVVVNNGVACSGSVARFLGLLAATMGRWDEATAHFEAALAMNARIGARPFEAHVQDEHAAMLLARHQVDCSSDDTMCAHRRQARMLTESALATGRALGMALLVERAERRLAVLDTAPPAATTRPVPVEAAIAPGLTAREAEVLRLLAAGQTGRQIAEALVLSVSTVERHIANVYAKIGAHGRADAVAYAFRHGLAHAE